MKKMRVNFFSAILFMTLTFSPIFPFSHGALGEESEACWPMYQTGRDTLSAYWEVMRACALPPAWGNLNQAQEDVPIYQTVAKWEARTAHHETLN